MPHRAQEQEMVETLAPYRHRHRSARNGELTEILTFALLGLALSFFAIGEGWGEPVEFLTSLFLLLG